MAQAGSTRLFNYSRGSVVVHSATKPLTVGTLQEQDSDPDWFTVETLEQPRMSWWISLHSPRSHTYGWNQLLVVEQAGCWYTIEFVGCWYIKSWWLLVVGLAHFLVHQYSPTSLGRQVAFRWR